MLPVSEVIPRVNGVDITYTLVDFFTKKSAVVEAMRKLRPQFIILTVRTNELNCRNTFSSLHIDLRTQLDDCRVATSGADFWHIISMMRNLRTTKANDSTLFMEELDTHVRACCKKHTPNVKEDDNGLDWDWEDAGDYFDAGDFFFG